MVQMLVSSGGEKTELLEGIQQKDEEVQRLKQKGDLVRERLDNLIKKIEVIA